MPLRLGGRSLDPVPLTVGVVLSCLALLVVWDTTGLTLSSVYGMGPKATPYLIATGLAALAIGHFIASLSAASAPREAADHGPVAWIGGGLAAVVAILWVGGGFIVAMMVLFAATARAFGRRAILQDLGIGLVLGLAMYLLFTKLLALSLPQGPIEHIL